MSEENLNWWKCLECGYMFQAAQPPKMCPSCKEKCAFFERRRAIRLSAAVPNQATQIRGSAQNEREKDIRIRAAARARGQGTFSSATPSA